MAPLELSSDVLLERLRRGRADRGLSQQQVADRLGVARTTLIAIEAGQRQLRPTELLTLADIYGLRIETLLRESPAARPLAAQFRTATGRLAEQQELRSAAEDLQELAEDYVALERELNAPLVTNYPPPRPLTGDPERSARQLAEQERGRLGLGDGPLPHLREVLEDEVGLRIFAIALPSTVGGLFAYDEELGGCVAMNALHPYERQRWSLAHEYAHFLSRRDRAEVTVDVKQYRRVPASERFADAFSRHFLMPEAGLRRRWETVTNGSAPTVATLVTEADRWGISLQAFTLWLEQLRLARAGTYDSLVVRKFTPDKARTRLGLPEHPRDTKIVGRRMRLLAVTAYADGDLSEERFARFLRTDRVTARRIAAAALDADSGT